MFVGVKIITDEYCIIYYNPLIWSVRSGLLKTYQSWGGGSQSMLYIFFILSCYESDNVRQYCQQFLGETVVKWQRSDTAQRQERVRSSTLFMVQWGGGWAGAKGHVVCAREAPAEVSGGEALTASAAALCGVDKQNAEPGGWLGRCSSGFSLPGERKQTDPFACAHWGIQRRLIIIWRANAILI